MKHLRKIRIPNIEKEKAGRKGRTEKINSLNEKRKPVGKWIRRKGE